MEAPPVPSLSCLIGTSVRGAASRVESNEERDLPALLAHRLVGCNSSCSPRAASKLAHETNTGSDSRCCYPRLAESSNASEPMFATRAGRSPEMKRPRGLLSDEGDASEAADVGTWRLVQALTWGVTTLGEDGVAAL